MSRALYQLGGLRFWNENEIQLREIFQCRAALVVKETLVGLNPAWQVIRVEGPCLSPREKISKSYTDNDIFVTNHKAGEDFLCLRAETTPSSYEFARGKKLPLCIWQVGKSFRRETNDGASAAKLRYNEFYQQEFQCIYSNTTKADYRSSLIDNLRGEIERFTQYSTRVVDSERLPTYSESTLDIEVLWKDKWKEVASCSIRNDFSPETKVCEIALGLDRIVDLSN